MNGNTKRCVGLLTHPTSVGSDFQVGRVQAERLNPWKRGVGTKARDHHATTGKWEVTRIPQSIGI